MNERNRENHYSPNNTKEEIIPQQNEIFSVEQQIADTLRTRILNGEYLVQLPNRARLSSELGCTPIRLQKAFAILEEEQLIRSVARQGTYLNLDRVREYQEGLSEE